MKTWLTAKELAGMPGMPATESGVKRFLTRDKTPSRSRKGKGGGQEYDPDSLPAETRKAIYAAAMPPALQTALVSAEITGTLERAANSQRKEQSLVSYQSLPMKAKQRAEIKLEILRAIDEMAREIGWGEAAIRLIHNYRAYPEWNAAIPRISIQSLYRWRKVFRDNGIAALAGRYQPHKQTLMKSEIDIHNVFMSVIHYHPTASAVHIYDLTLAALDPSTPKPALRTVQRWLAAWRRANPGVYAYLVNPDQARGRFRPAMGNAAEDVTRLLQRWELDSTPSDVMLLGQRYAVIGCIDVYSRRGKLLVSKTSKATAIALLIRRCILDWGIPEECKTDNGSDYVSKYLERVLLALEIEHSKCAPFSPWLKPHIERFFRTFSHGVAELLPGFIGHNVQEQAARRSRTFSDRFMTRGETVEISLEPAQFQEFCALWVDGIYAQKRHSALGCSPAQRWMSYHGEIRRISTERALDLLLAEGPGGEFRTIQKKGLQIDTHYYIAPEFGDPNLVGQRVRVLLDPIDLGKVVVLDGEFRFICIATCPELAGTDRRQVAAAAQKLQKDRLQAARQAMRDAAKKVKLVDALESHLRIAAEKAKVLPFTAAVEHETIALAAAKEAIEATQPQLPAPLTEEDQQAAIARLRALDAQAPDGEEPWERYNRLYRLLPAVTDEDRAWMVQFEATPEGKALLSVLAAPEDEWNLAP